MNCPHCHKPLASNSRFCGACGQRIDSAPQSSPPEAPQAVGHPGPVPAAAGAVPTDAAYTGAAHVGAEQRTGTAAAGLIERAKNMILAPRHEWEVIAPEASSIAQLYAGYIVPMSIFAAVMTFVHVSVIGVRVPFAGLVRSPMTSGLTSAVIGAAFGLVGVYIYSFIVNALAPTFGGVRDSRQAMKIAAYSLTPAWLSTVLALSPVLATLLQFLAGCYGIYVLYLGLPVLMRSPRERAVGYTASVVICCIVVGILLGLLSAAFGHFGMRGGLAGLAPAQTEAAQEARQEEASKTVGNAIGNMLGTDEKGKEGLGNAISNLAKAGKQMEQQQAATSQGSGNGDTGSSSSSAQDTTSGSAPAQSPMGAVGGLLNALGSSLGGPNRVEPVAGQSLTNLLPSSLAGMKRSNVKSEGNSAIGIKTTRAEADYSGPDGTAHLEIADVSGVSGLMDMASSLVQNSTSESDAGYERDVQIGGRPAHEKWDAHARKGEISMVIAKRFTVEVTGEGVPMATLEHAYGDIDLASLEGMKNSGAK